jgi:hypothetical protein
LDLACGDTCITRISGGAATLRAGRSGRKLDEVAVRPGEHRISDPCFAVGLKHLDEPSGIFRRGEDQGREHVGFGRPPRFASLIHGVTQLDQTAVEWFGYSLPERLGRRLEEPISGPEPDVPIRHVVLPES